MNRLLTFCAMTTVLLLVSASQSVAADGVITYKNGSQPRRMDVWVTGSDGHLYANYWTSGTPWKWGDYGTPLGTTVSENPSVITYKDGTQPQHRHVFVRGTDGHLYMHFNIGSGWQWDDLGTPGGATVDESPDAITYIDDTQSRRIYVFVKGSDGHLYVCFRKKSTSAWAWANRGKPSGTTVSESPNVITYKDDAKRQRIYAFVKGSDKHLHVHYWNGSNWIWSDRGRPPGTFVSGQVSATTFSDVFVPTDSLPPTIAAKGGGGAAPRLILAFVRGSSGNLYMHRWTGSKWEWVDLGKPEQPPSFGSPSVVSYREPSHLRRLFVFVIGSDDHLYMNTRGGSGWQWTDQGISPGPVFDIPQVITFRDRAEPGAAIKPRRIYSFVKNPNDELYVNHWTGSAWAWANQGAPP